MDDAIAMGIIFEVFCQLIGFNWNLFDCQLSRKTGFLGPRRLLFNPFAV